ncbi:MAG: hypothetical protein M1504_01990 [Candidatus Marsarchaeota archaeon]|nr:hypothetical protein [Candidatus Marsarchaeota archaeon]
MNMNNKIMGALGLRQIKRKKEENGENKLIVYSNNGIMQGKAYCKKEDVAEYIKSIMVFPTERLCVVIQKE